MNIIRYIDVAAQLVIIFFLIDMAITGELLGAGAAFGLLGIWQLVSAFINTFFFYHNSLSIKIKIYWFAAIISLLLAFLQISESVSMAGMVCAALTAIWYIIILINLIKIVNNESKTIADSKNKEK